MARKSKKSRKRKLGSGPCIGGYMCSCKRCAPIRDLDREMALAQQGREPVLPWEDDLPARDGLRARRLRGDGRGLRHGRAPAT